MNINVQQLEVQMNLHCLQPNFLNYELHYILAKDESTFRFTDWEEEPAEGEQKFYCVLMDKEMVIPAGNVVLKESYKLVQEPPYPVIHTCKDFIPLINEAREKGTAKGIRHFDKEEIEKIKSGLEEEFQSVKKHLVTSPEAQHQLFVIDDVEISVSISMVYFRQQMPFSEKHYEHILEEKG